MFVLALVPALACSFDDSAPGLRDQCATTVGQPFCLVDPIESAEDACWRLVSCGSIPVASPEDQNYFDQPTCEAFLQRVSNHRFQIALACIETSTCDQLRFRDGSSHPSTNQERMPLCLEYGDQ